MGVLLDTTVLVAAERRRLSAAQMIFELTQTLGLERDFGVSAVTIMEFAHGEARADTPQRAQQRKEFLDDLLELVTAIPFNPEAARRAGRLDGELTSQGIRIAFPDLVIGVTALTRGWRLLTANVRHMDRIPGLTIIQQT